MAIIKKGTEHIHIDADDESRIITVTLDKQPLNICDRYFYNEISMAFREINLMEGYCVVLLKSNCRHFCAGGELEEIQLMHSQENVNIIARGATQAFEDIYNCKYPVVCAVHGKAPGAGTCIAAVSDVVIAEEGALFAMPEMTAGSICAAEYLELIIPKRLARYYIFTGSFLTAQEMKKWGAVLDVVPKEQLYDRAMEVAKQIAQQSPLALAYMKKYMNENDDDRLSEKFMSGSRLTPIYNATEDCNEAYWAIKEKRKPVYRGR